MAPFCAAMKQPICTMLGLYLPTPEEALQALQALQTPSVTASITEKPAENSQKTEPVTDVTPNSDKAGDVTDNDPFARFKDPSLKLKLGG